jgi:hypothetical protein
MEGNMKIDLYTKAILTVIAIGIGCLVFEQKPVKEAQAARSLEQRVAKLERGRKGLSNYPFKCDTGGIRGDNGKITSLKHGLLGRTDGAAAERVVRCLYNHSTALSILAYK